MPARREEAFAGEAHGPRAGQGITGGEGGIRTPDTLSGMAAFEAARFNRSRTSPRRM